MAAHDGSPNDSPAYRFQGSTSDPQATVTHTHTRTHSWQCHILFCYFYWQTSTKYKKCANCTLGKSLPTCVQNKKRMKIYLSLISGLTGLMRFRHLPFAASSSSQNKLGPFKLTKEKHKKQLEDFVLLVCQKRKDLMSALCAKIHKSPWFSNLRRNLLRFSSLIVHIDASYPQILSIGSTKVYRFGINPKILCGSLCFNLIPVKAITL